MLNGVAATAHYSKPIHRSCSHCRADICCAWPFQLLTVPYDKFAFFGCAVRCLKKVKSLQRGRLTAKSSAPSLQYRETDKKQALEKKKINKPTKKKPSKSNRKCNNTPWVTTRNALSFTGVCHHIQ